MQASMVHKGYVSHFSSRGGRSRATVLFALAEEAIGTAVLMQRITRLIRGKLVFTSPAQYLPEGAAGASNLCLRIAALSYRCDNLKVFDESGRLVCSPLSNATLCLSDKYMTSHVVLHVATREFKAFKVRGIREIHQVSGVAGRERTDQKYESRDTYPGRAKPVRHGPRDTGVCLPAARLSRYGSQGLLFLVTPSST